MHHRGSVLGRSVSYFIAWSGKVSPADETSGRVTLLGILLCSSGFETIDLYLLANWPIHSDALGVDREN